MRGASVSPDDGRRLLLMVAAATGLPEIYYGDSDVGNHATAQIVERPTELQFRARQQVWSSLFMKVVNYVLYLQNIELNDSLHISFPDITEHDVKARVEAIIMATTLDGHKHANMITRENTARLLMTELGLNDHDDHIEKLREIWSQLDKEERDKAELENKSIELQNKNFETRDSMMKSRNNQAQQNGNGMMAAQPMTQRGSSNGQG